ncbi:MAG: hypothetical protein EPN97_06745 [Alphaproteobacteria bacterium]|nr:MAG: hypothetical protein EPN97_06745 [Alphaproteobacteria bacterium]
MEKKEKKRDSLEREVIVAVTILYLLIMGAVLAIHYLQPEGQETVTSSPSPSQSHFSVDKKPEPEQH